MNPAVKGYGYFGRLESSRTGLQVEPEIGQTLLLFDRPWWIRALFPVPALEVPMNVDQEFFSIVEQLGPMGDINLQSFESHPATRRRAVRQESGDRGSSSASACCSTENNASSCESSFPALCPPLEPSRISPDNQGAG